jgi:hypothetical protein
VPLRKRRRNRKMIRRRTKRRMARKVGRNKQRRMVRNNRTRNLVVRKQMRKSHEYVIAIAVEQGFGLICAGAEERIEI